MSDRREFGTSSSSQAEALPAGNQEHAAREDEELQPLFSQENFFGLAERLTGFSKEQLQLLQEVTGDPDEFDEIEDDDDEISLISAPAVVLNPRPRAFDISTFLNCSSSTLSTRYRDALKNNVFKLAQEVVKEELEIYNTLRNEFSHTLLELTAIRILGSSNELVLRAILSGNLPKAHAQDRATRSAFHQLRRSAPKQPVIYAQCFADDAGNSPTVAEWYMALEKIVTYCEGGNPDVILEMDSVRFRSTTNRRVARQNIRHYFKARSETSVARVVTLWAKKLMDRLEVIADWNEPLLPALMEYGYTRHIAARLKQHREHKSSNLLLNLADCALQVTCNGKYALQQYVVYNTWGPEQAVMAEIIFTRLGQGYAQDAAGFNAYPAGRSNASAYEITVESWAHIRKTALEKTAYPANIRLIESKSKTKAREELEIEKQWKELQAKISALEEEKAQFLAQRDEEAKRSWAENWTPDLAAEIDGMVRDFGGILGALQHLLPPGTLPPTDSQRRNSS